MRTSENTTVSPLDDRRLRKCLSHFATGVTIVTTRVGEDVHGVTVNAFTSVSLDPPLVLVSIGCNTRACELMKGNDFVVNVLGTDHAALALHFAGAAPTLEAIPWEEGRRGPRLAGCLAHIECSPWVAQDAGDHTLFVGKVEHFEVGGGDPLIFYDGQFQPAKRDEAQDVVQWSNAVGGGWLGEEPLYRQASTRPGK